MFVGASTPMLSQCNTLSIPEGINVRSDLQLSFAQKQNERIVLAHGGRNGP